MDTKIRQLERQAATGSREAHQALLCTKQRVGRRRLLGMSLSFCIKSVLQGDVQPNEIFGIISNTHGFVLTRPWAPGRYHSYIAYSHKGTNYQTIFDRYMETYWRNWSREQVEQVCSELLQRISERKHGLPDSWIDADSPYEWGQVPQGSGEGMVGTYINPANNEILQTPNEIRVYTERR